MKRDFDYYIKAVREAEEHCQKGTLVRGINQVIRSVLETQRKRGKTLDEIANILDEIAGPKKWRSVQVAGTNNLRVAAKQIRAREKLVLI
jgi:hypothetical protein